MCKINVFYINERLHFYHIFCFCLVLNININKYIFIFVSCRVVSDVLPNNHETTYKNKALTKFIQLFLIPLQKYNFLFLFLIVVLLTRFCQKYFIHVKVDTHFKPFFLPSNKRKDNVIRVFSWFRFNVELFITYY